MGLFCPIIQKTYNNVSSYTQLQKMDIGGQYNREELADLSSTVKPLIPSPYKTEDKSLV